MISAMTCVVLSLIPEATEDDEKGEGDSKGESGDTETKGDGES